MGSFSSIVASQVLKERRKLSRRTWPRWRANPMLLVTVEAMTGVREAHPRASGHKNSLKTLWTAVGNRQLLAASEAVAAGCGGGRRLGRRGRGTKGGGRCGGGQRGVRS